MMSATLSNQLKALLVTEDITEQGVNVWQNNSFTVQHFSYECQRKRNDAGLPFGATLPAYLDFTVRIASGESGKVFVERMKLNGTFPYSFLFNASFNGLRQLSEYQDAMVARGYVVDLEESYDKAPGADGSTEQMLLHARLLLSKLSYLGRERVLDLTITND